MSADAVTRKNAACDYVMRSGSRSVSIISAEEKSSNTRTQFESPSVREGVFNFCLLGSGVNAAIG